MEKLTLADLDGTIRPSVSKDILLYQARFGILGKEEIDKAREIMARHEKGELTHEEYVKTGLVEWARFLKGKSYKEVLDISRQYFVENQDQILIM